MTDPGRWIIRWPAPLTPRLRLLCFPYAGGGASVYRPWREHLPPDVELCAVQLPGRESRLSEPPWYQLSALLPQLHRGLSGLLDLPYATFGHSLGALVSFEFVRQLRRCGDPLPRHLFASGRGAPQVPVRSEPIHRLPDAEFVREIARFRATRPEVLADPDLLELVLPALRADFALSERYRYRPEPPLPCPITAFYGIGDTSVRKDDVSAWGSQTSAAWRVRAMPGDHFFLRPAQPRLLAEIGSSLA
ncbi:thioesterase domain-containing protein [Amycolatopsis sp. FU40]|uniref:thioesterase II family protein n=1 Tax=Amycolatopsis sp. FU40 TaxID=2914159 RepID=UPI001F014AC1|nr:thioesterase domain-containing protein [Amycolatopsis sp. FU40]UKD58043.1 thioesterase domain-containing protein [Amycolatopsis sp. FU40]